MKRADMHWTLGAANAILALHFSMLSNRQDFLAAQVTPSADTAGQALAATAVEFDVASAVCTEPAA